MHWIQDLTFKAWGGTNGLFTQGPQIDTWLNRPFYAQPGEPELLPPDFTDASSREFPDEGYKYYAWTGQTFLVSENSPKTATVYGGVQWGWNAEFSPGPNPPSKWIPKNRTLWVLSNVEMIGFWGVATANGWLETGSCGVLICASYILVNEGAYNYTFTGSDWIMPSQVPPTPCVIAPCPPGPPEKAVLSLASSWDYPKASAIFSLEDAGRIFPGYSGTLIGVAGTGPSQ